MIAHPGAEGGLVAANGERTAEKLFGTDGARLIEFARMLIEDFEQHPVQYDYMEPQDYQRVVHEDWKRGAKIYWEETLGRAHFAAATSIIRAHRWCAGMSVAYSASLFLPFCASFRSLIESAADGYDALGHVASTLAECRSLVNPILQLNAPTNVVAAELEDVLIHFSHARKVSKGEVAPQSHNAKTAADYVKGLERGISGLYECYSNLCQFTHPAALSVGQLLAPLSSSSFVLIPAHDELRIEGLIEAYKQLVVPLFMFAFNPGAVVLKVLLHFQAPQFHSRGIAKMDLRGVPGWPKYARRMGVEC